MGAALLFGSRVRAAEGDGISHVQSATAITQVFGDGQRLTAVALEYDRHIDTSTLSSASFAVDGRTVTRVYANSAPELALQGVDGRYVIVELSLDDPAALLWGNGQAQGSAAGAGSGATHAATAAAGQVGPNPGVMPTAGQAGPQTPIAPAKAAVTQVQTIKTSHGTVYAGGTSAVMTTKVSNLVVDDFQQFRFTDPATGQTLDYNLFIPRHYDPRRSYPLVLFMHDASVVSTETIATLIQGLGAVSFASPRDQARHESFVLAPEYPVVVIDDNYQPTPLFDATVNLVRNLTEQYSIDPGRLYATGQSMGAMMTLGMNIKYPELFAASYVVAGQWPADQATPLAQKNLWVVVSQGDDKAYPMENAIMAVVEGEGTQISTATWDGRWTPGQFDAAAMQLEAEDSPVNYASFVPGTDLPAGSSEGSNPGEEHVNTWRVAYTIDAIRDWLFQQHL